MKIKTFIVAAVLITFGIIIGGTGMYFGMSGITKQAVNQSTEISKEAINKPTNSNVTNNDIKNKKGELNLSNESAIQDTIEKTWKFWK